MSAYEEPALFDGPDNALGAAAWPQLPAAPQWQTMDGGFGQWCGYCVLHARRDPRGLWRTPLRRPCWRRTGTDGAELLLCGTHADLFLDEFPANTNEPPGTTRVAGR